MGFVHLRTHWEAADDSPWIEEATPRHRPALRRTELAFQPQTDLLQFDEPREQAMLANLPLHERRVSFLLPAAGGSARRVPPEGLGG